MKVAISSISPFHAFDLARQMERLGYLGRLYTGYPSWRAQGLPPAKVSSFPWLMLPQVVGRIGAQTARECLSRCAIQSFDRWVARKLGPCDVFHSLSSFGLRSHRVARDRGALTVCDRGSSHILFQDRILAEEHERWGLPYRPIDRSIVERELAEYQECDLIFVPSQFARRSFVEMGVPERKLRLNPYGVDLSLFKPIPKQDDTFRVLYVGALSLRKGLPYLLEAIAGLDLPRFETWLIGAAGAEVRPFLSKYQESYRYLGAMPQAELYKYYSQASVMVMPSVEDGFGLVMAQAMACGLPVISTTNTGAADLFTDGVEGFIVPIRGAEAIRERIVELYEHPGLRAQMAAAALRPAARIRGWDAYGERAAAFYAEALSAGAGRAEPAGPREIHAAAR